MGIALGIGRRARDRLLAIRVLGAGRERAPLPTADHILFIMPALEVKRYALSGRTTVIDRKNPGMELSDQADYR